MVVDGALAHWQEFRRGVSAEQGNHRFRTWLFGELAAHSTEHDHSFGLFEIAIGIAGRGLIDDAFLVLGWLAERYAGHPDPDLAWRVIMGLTDDCVKLAFDSPKHNPVAQLVLREVADRAGTNASVEIERATCRALVQLAMLRSIADTRWDTRRAHVAEVWTEVTRRWQGSADPELRGRVAQALVNLALLALQFDDEPAARRAFADVVLRFGDAPSGLDGDLGHFVMVARYADRVLDRVTFAAPEFQLDYLRRQSHWYPEAVVDSVRVVEWARRVHTQSAGTVRSWACAGQPFVLLLRNFEMTERSGVATAEFFMAKEEPADHVKEITYRDADSVLKDLDARVPLLQVASTTAGDLEVDPFKVRFIVGNRLYLPTASWFQTVSMLITIASQIIVWTDVLTPSLSKELDELIAQGRTDDTVILLEPHVHEPGSALPRRAGEVLTTDHPTLAPFPNRVDCATLKGRGVADCTELMRLLQRLYEVAQQPVGPRFGRLLARLDETT